MLLQWQHCSVMLQEPFVTCYVKHDTPCNISRHSRQAPQGSHVKKSTQGLVTVSQACVKVLLTMRSWLSHRTLPTGETVTGLGHTGQGLALHCGADYGVCKDL